MLNSQISHRTPRKKEKNIFNFFYFCISRGKTLQYSLTNFLQDYTLILMTFHACLLSQQCLEQTSLQVKLLFSYHSTLACHSPVIKTVRRTLTYMFLKICLKSCLLGQCSGYPRDACYEKEPMLLACQ